MCAILKLAHRSRKLELYREVTDRIREADVDVVLNLTAGMGGDMVFGLHRRAAAAQAGSPPT
jgi:uncharacterized protein (DUF849 family)